MTAWKWIAAAAWLCGWLGVPRGQAQAPIPASLPDPVYPAIAKAAHVHGEVVAGFTIDADGRVSGVQIVSGQPMLRGSVTAAMANWRFRVPLPMGAETSFTATFNFAVEGADDPDSLDFPPYYPCCGEGIMGGESVSVKIVGAGGSQEIARAKVPLPPTGPSCADDANVQAPTSTSADDFVELYRKTDGYSFAEYEVRVYRNGRVEWNGLRGAAALGPRQAQIPQAAAEALLARMAKTGFWLRCSLRPQMPEVNLEPPDPDAEPVDKANLWIPTIHLTASIGGLTKTIDVSLSDMGNDYGGQRLAWVVDQVTDTHRWRHPDAAIEPIRNMNDDILLGKPGVTLLMRAIYRLGDSRYSMAQTGDGPRLDSMRDLLAAGESANAADESGWTALMYLAWLRPSDEAVTRLLLAAGADARHRSLHGDTALLIEAQNRYFDPLLLAAGAELNERNADGATPVMLLARDSDAEPLRKALAAGADPTAKDGRGWTALDYLAEGACSISVPKPVPCPPLNAAYVANRKMLMEAMRAWPGRPGLRAAGR